MERDQAHKVRSPTSLILPVRSVERTTQENVAAGPTSVSSVVKKVTSPRIALLKWIKGQINLVYKDPD